MIAWCPSSAEIASLLLAVRCLGSSRTFPAERRLLCLEMIEAARLLLVYRRAQYLARSSSSLTPKISWNFSIGMAQVITFFTDDKQLYTGALPSEFHGCRLRISSCT